jgi:hypothetical protein
MTVAQRPSATTEWLSTPALGGRERRPHRVYPNLWTNYSRVTTRCCGGPQGSTDFHARHPSWWTGYPAPCGRRSRPGGDLRRRHRHGQRPAGHGHRLPKAVELADADHHGCPIAVRPGAYRRARSQRSAPDRPAHAAWSGDTTGHAVGEHTESGDGRPRQRDSTRRTPQTATGGRHRPAMPVLAPPAAWLTDPTTGPLGPPHAGGGPPGDLVLVHQGRHRPTSSQPPRDDRGDTATPNTRSIETVSEFLPLRTGKIELPRRVSRTTV